MNQPAQRKQGIRFNPFTAIPRPLRARVFPFVILVLWWATFRFGWKSAQLLVSISTVFDVAAKQLSSTNFYDALLASLRRDLIGFTIGASTGLIFGGVMGLSRLADKLVGPMFHAIKQVSHFAWIPLISVWFGMGDMGKIVFLSLAAFFPVVLNTFEGVRSVNRDFMDVARVYGYTRRQLFSRVVLPSAAPAILTGIQLALIYSWSASLGAEYLLQAGQGIGNILIDGREQYRMDLVIFGVLVVGVVGLVITRFARALESRLLRWRVRSATKLSMNTTAS